MVTQPPDTLDEELRRCYPSLQGVSSMLPAAAGYRGVRVLDVALGTRLFMEGQACEAFPLVLSGEVQVAHASSDGRCLELYRVGRGQVCLVSAAGLLSRRPLSARGTATRDTRLALVPPDVFERWSDHAPFRQFVFGVFSERLADLIAVVDAVAFQRLDRRLADYIVKAGPHLHATHQQLADELGTVREMITRLLNRFEAMGLVTLGREHIAIADASSLHDIAGGRIPAP